MRPKKNREVNIFSASVVDLFASGLGVFLIVSIIALVNQKKENEKLGKGGESEEALIILKEKISDLENELEKKENENFILQAKQQVEKDSKEKAKLFKDDQLISKMEVESLKLSFSKQELKLKQKIAELSEQVSNKNEIIKEKNAEIKKITLINQTQGDDSGQVFQNFDVGEKITLDDVRFYPGTDRPIEPYASKEIIRFANFLKSNPNVTVEVSGHIFETKKAIETNKADDVYNLSGRRARAVCQKLMEFGVSDKRLNCIGYGANRPIHLTNDQYSEKAQKNRRVEIEILSK